MIIRNKNKKEPEKEEKKEQKSSGSKIIKSSKEKKQIRPLNLKMKLAQEEKQKELLELEAAKKQNEFQKPQSNAKKETIETVFEEYSKIDITEIEFKERYERRRGERRRGFRRIDERSLVSRAQEEAKNIREIAAKEGYKSGLIQAKDEIEELKTSLKEFISAKKNIYDDVSSNILEIALEVAKKIIKIETTSSNEVLRAVVSEVFGELSNSEEKITIKVNPEEVEFARASVPEILEDSGIEAKISIIGEDNIDKGSCIVVANNGVIDANFKTQLAIVQNAFGIYKGGV